ncbi:MAG: MarR family transcriptional regulator [Planctomycetota bacterium]|nr:MAG: MarR family transcriptional regulator [Planctomycetota bacterium]
MAQTPFPIAISVQRISEHLRSRLEDAYAPFQINEPRAAVLETISIAGPEGCSQTELAEALGASESNVSTLIERMRRDGLLFRMRSRLDRRCSVLLLSDEGRDKLAQIDALRQQRMADALKGLTIEEQSQLHLLLDRWRRVLALTARESEVVASRAVRSGEAA